MKRFTATAALVLALLATAALADNYPLHFNDAAGHAITITAPPQRVVSLVPSITEMLLRIGAADAVCGITYHSVLPPEAAGKAIIGGFFHPDLASIKKLRPQVVFYAALQQEIVAPLRGRVQLVRLDINSIADAFATIRLLGRMFNCEQRAAAIVAGEQRQLELIRRKTAAIPAAKRVRVLRLMGRDSIMTPGDDSFQNDYIRAAGAIAPHWGKNGSVIGISLQQWREFNPQFIYACYGDKQVAELLRRPGWNEVDAVRNARIVYFPCDLTCRAATHCGYFTAWLAASIYPQWFGDPTHFVLPQQVVDTRPLQVDCPGVKQARLVTSTIKDFRNKAVVITFDRPTRIVSTLEGERDAVTTLANNYFPPPAWGLGHHAALAALRASTLKVLGLNPEHTSILFTGADMDNVAVEKRSYRALQVVAVVTAGVHGNAMRMGADSGTFYPLNATDHNNKPGTINIILLNNARMSRRAMTRAIITATEAKSAALQDLDIRSSYARSARQATGTGTDNIVVASGTGPAIDSSGGHTKMGELVARAVYAAVQRAIWRQNGLVSSRPVFQRLRERDIDLYQLCRNWCDDDGDVAPLYARLEKLLLRKDNAGFIEALMAISDDVNRGLIQDDSAVDAWCRAVAHRNGAAATDNIPSLPGQPQPLLKGLAALLTAAATELD